MQVRSNRRGGFIFGCASNMALPSGGTCTQPHAHAFSSLHIDTQSL